MRPTTVVSVVGGLIWSVRRIPAAVCRTNQVNQVSQVKTGAPSWLSVFVREVTEEQIMTVNHRKKKERITKKKLAHDIAKRIQTHLEELEVSR